MPKSQKNSQASKVKRKHFKTINGGKSYSANHDSAFEDMDWHPLDDQIDNARDNKKYVKNITPRTEGQKVLMDAIKDYNLTVAMGPAGTGKTYLAVATGVEALLKGDVDRIILSRPAMEAGESLGYLPGDMHEKMAPYLRPLYDVLGDRLGGKKVRQLLDDGTIEIAPIGFMRGRTLNNSFIVIDEAQNCTYQQLKMILSRLGWHSTMVVTGDPAQSDLLNGLSGLSDIADRLNKTPNIGVVQLEQRDIVRHPLVAEMLEVL